MDISWLRIESWHCVLNYVEGQSFKTLCGLEYGPLHGLEMADRLGIERSCETCFRNLVRGVDVEPGEIAETESSAAEPDVPMDYEPFASPQYSEFER